MKPFVLCLCVAAVFVPAVLVLSSCGSTGSTQGTGASGGTYTPSQPMSPAASTNAMRSEYRNWMRH